MARRREMLLQFRSSPPPSPPPLAPFLSRPSYPQYYPDLSDSSTSTSLELQEHTAMSKEEGVKIPPTVGETFTSPTLVVKIGAAKKAYHVSKALITHYSEYFRGAFGSSNFEEGRTGEVALQDVESATFEPFLDWLYGRELSVPLSWSNKYDGAGRHSSSENVTNLYIFADRFIVPKLKRDVSTLAVAEFNAYHTPTCAAITSAFESLPDTDPFLQLLVDAHCRNYSEFLDQEQAKSFEQLPTKFFLRMTNTYSKAYNSKDLVLEDYTIDGGGHKEASGSKRRVTVLKRRKFM